MTPEKAQIEQLEQDAYREAIEQHMREWGEEELPWRHRFIPDYLAILKGEEVNGKVQPPSLTVESLRYYVREELSKEPDFVLDDSYRRRREAQYVAIGRDVATDMAVTYFKELKAYLEARETGVEEIDEIRSRVAVSSALLLRQIEGTLKKFEPPRHPRDLWNADKQLGKVIDFQRVEKETGFKDVLANTGLNHFGAATAEGIPRMVTHTPYLGLQAPDILAMVNSQEDLNLHNTEDQFNESTKIGEVHTDGTIDLDRQSP